MVNQVLRTTFNRTDTSKASLLSDGRELSERISVRDQTRSHHMGVSLKRNKRKRYCPGLKEGTHKDWQTDYMEHSEETTKEDVRHVHGTEDSLS